MIYLQNETRKLYLREGLRGTKKGLGIGSGNPPFKPIPFCLSLPEVLPKPPEVQSLQMPEVQKKT